MKSFVFLSLLATSPAFAAAQPNYECSFTADGWSGGPEVVEVYRLPGGRYGSEFGVLHKQSDESGVAVWASAGGGSYPRLLVNQANPKTAELIVHEDNEETKSYFCEAK